MNKTRNNLILLGLEILLILAFGIMVFTPTEIKAYDEYSYFNDYSYSLIFEPKEPLNNPKPSISLIKPNSIDKIRGKTTITIIGNGFTPDSVVRKNNSNRTTIFIDSKHLLVDIFSSDAYNQNEFYLTVFNGEPGGGFSNASLFTIKNGTGTDTTTTRTTNSTITNYSSTQNSSNSNYNTNYSNTSSEENDSVSASDFNENYGSLTANALLGSNSFMPTGLVQWILFVVLILLIIFLWRYMHRSKEKYMLEPMKHA